MFQVFSKYRSGVVRLALLALLIRVLVPAGYMPVAVAGGWYLELCPDGIPLHTVAALFGDSPHDQQSHTQHHEMPSHANMHAGMHDLSSHQILGHHQSVQTSEHSSHLDSHVNSHAEHQSDGQILDQCDLGSLFGSSILLLAEEITLPVSLNPLEYILDAIPVVALEQLRRFRSRAPPLFIL